jgi:hypothetical protein
MAEIGVTKGTESHLVWDRAAGHAAMRLYTVENYQGRKKEKMVSVDLLPALVVMVEIVRNQFA